MLFKRYGYFVFKEISFRQLLNLTENKKTIFIYSDFSFNVDVIVIEYVLKK